MSKSMHVFRIPLGPAIDLGLSTRQLEKRTREAQQMVHAIMPSTRFLTSGVLGKRLTSEDGLFWLAYDIEESPQMPLFNIGPNPAGRRITSTLANFYTELLRLREEAESAVIRVGELATLATELDSLPADESRTMLGELSPDDLQLWKLIHRRNGEPLAIKFEDRMVNLSLPTLSRYVSDGHVRTIRFYVHHPGKSQAKLSRISEVTNEITGAGHSTVCPRNMNLLRSPEGTIDRTEAWFFLYVAQYRNLVVEATVRLALNKMDFSPSHLELISISNSEELAEKMSGIARNLGINP